MEDHLSLPAYNRNVGSKISSWQQKVDGVPQAEPSAASSEPYHGMLHMQQISGHEMSYGKPKEGSRTEFRGKLAGVRISNEIVELCEVIMQYGTPLQDSTYIIKFGLLFEVYTKISNKLVGVLRRAKKQGLVEFEGEMLFQRRDDDVIIRLLKSPDELSADIERQMEVLKHHPQSVK